MNCLTACQILSWPTRSPDLSPIENVWGMMVRQMYQSGNVHHLALNWSKCGKKCRRKPSGSFISLCHAVWQLAYCCDCRFGR
ncbi:hypothetical protein X975_02096, partial [Stegodyphus mimosarum]